MTPKRRIIPVFVPHMGCPHTCVFCDQKTISGAITPATAEDVHDALRPVMKDEPGAEQNRTDALPAELAFYGGSFTALPVAMQNELLEAAAPFLGMDPRNSIRLSTRPDCIDESCLERLKTYRVATIEIGAQSMCDDVLGMSMRGHTSSDVVRSASMIKQQGFSLILQMMTGLPGDTYEKSVYTAQRLINLQPDGVRIYPTAVVRGTTLHELWLQGEYMPQTLGDAVGLCATLCGLFQNAGIPVIRLGLNPNEALSAGDAVAGAYHPAFGELVYSKMYCDRASAMLEGVMPGSCVRIVVPRGRTSRMTGSHRSNIYFLSEKYALKHLKIVESDMSADDIMIEMY